MKKPYNWKLFFILLAAAIFGALAVIPYSLAISGAQPIPLTWQILALATLQSVIMFGLATGLGLLLANSIGLGLPILEAALRREPTGRMIRDMLPISIILGVVAGVLIILLDAFVFQPALASELGDKAGALAVAATNAGPWRGFLASFYGGINEEILLRLFLMSLLAWIGRFISKTPEGTPTLAVLWIANVLAAVVFGLGHLPVTATIIPLTTLVILRAIILNGLGGIIFGYLYFKRGLESAIAAHFTADIVLHVLFGI